MNTDVQRAVFWGSMKVGTYTVLCAKINMNWSLNGVVHQNQYEYSCTPSYAPE